MRIAGFVKSPGTDVQIHTVGPLRRHCLPAIVSTYNYEMELVGLSLGVTYDWGFIPSKQIDVSEIAS